MHDLSGKTVLVTGASKGIGAATTTRLGAAGADVIAHYGSDEAGAIAATASIQPDRRHLVSADLRGRGAGRSLWRAAEVWRGRVDVVVLNAATMPDTPLDADDGAWDAGWQTSWRVNVIEPASIIRQAVRHFCTLGGGVLIVLSSCAAQRGASSQALTAYAASKAALQAMTLTIANTYARNGVLAYVVAPGVVRTRLSVAAASDLGGEAAMTAGLPLGEWVPPAELAELITFLATGACRQLTGATLDINGASHIR